MKPRPALTAVTTLLAVLAAVTPATAARSNPMPSTLGTHLAYRTTTWTSQGEEMSIRAPRGWDFVLTPEGQARFNAATRPDLLSMEYRGRGALRPQLDAKLAALSGTPTRGTTSLPRWAAAAACARRCRRAARGAGTRCPRRG